VRGEVERCQGTYSGYQGGPDQDHIEHGNTPGKKKRNLKKKQRSMTRAGTHLTDITTQGMFLERRMKVERGVPLGQNKRWGKGLGWGPLNIAVWGGAPQRGEPHRKKGKRQRVWGARPKPAGVGDVRESVFVWPEQPVQEQISMPNGKRGGEMFPGVNLAVRYMILGFRC